MDRVKSGNVVLWENEKITLLEIKPYDAEFQKNFSYSKDNNDGKTIIIRVDYEITSPDGSDNSPYVEGVYSDWAMILVRDNSDSKWYIYDQGY